MLVLITAGKLLQTGLKIVMRRFYPSFLPKLYKKTDLLFFIIIAACYAFALPPKVYISGEASVCYGNEARYTVGGTVRCPSFSWRVLGGQIITSANSFIVVRWNGAGEGEVSVRTSGCGTNFSAVKTVFVGGARQPDMPAVTRNCGSTVLTRSTPPAEVTWYWQTSPQGRSLVNANETYTCTASTVVYLRAYDGNSGCWSPATSIPVTVSQPPDFTLSGNTAICPGASTQLSAEGSPDIAYSWSPVTGLSDPHIANPLASPAQSTTYFDGLGREIQTVLTQGSPSGKDVVQPLDYDAYGRQDRKYLPYADAAGTNGFYKPGAIKTPDAYQSSDQYLFYQAAAAVPGRHARDEAPYAQTIFEASPLNRVLEQGSPGAAFQPGTGRTVKFAEQTNAAGQVRLWDCSGSSCSSPGFYDANELYVTETRDEHDNLSLAFTDKQGKLVLKQVQEGQDLLSTYYVFDDLDNLRLVVQPEGVKRIPAGPFTPDAAFITAWCFRYGYDGRRRLTEKQVPGAGLVFLVYDQRDRLVLSQDAVQRESQQWTYTRYDALNRPVETGLYHPGETPDQAQMQARLDAFIASRPDNQNNTGLPQDASVTSFPDNIGQTETLTYTYYDAYSPELLSGKAFVPEIGVSDEGHSSNTYANLNHQVRGQVTGSRLKVLGSTAWLTTVNYYNGKNQLIQTIRDNPVGGTDRTTSQYDFAGRVLETLLTHTKGGGAEQYLVHNQFAYDHGGRLLETRQRTGTDAASLFSQPQVLLASYEYNELGQLVDKKLHSTDAGQTPPGQRKYLQSVD